jgi:hypothetical protein
LLRVPASAQTQFDNFQRDRARQMLRDVHDAIEHHYYDPTYHGVDLELPPREPVREPPDFK